MHLTRRNAAISSLMHPPDDRARTFAKRIIGLPGDVIETTGVANATPPCWEPTKVFIAPKGRMPFQMLCETELFDAWVGMAFCCNADGTASTGAMSVTLPPSDYFVMGDDRNHSSESRALGFVPAADIIGKVLRIEGRSTNLYANRPVLTQN